MDYIDAKLTRILLTHVTFDTVFHSCMFLQTHRELLICHISKREFGVIFSTTSRVGNNLKRKLGVVSQVVTLQDPKSLQNLIVCD